MSSAQGADLLLLLPRASSKDAAAFLVHHPERARLLPKLTLLNWRRLEGVCRYSVVQLKNHLYFIGGYKPGKRKYSRQVLRYELSSNSWYYCNKMRTGRADFQAFVFDGRIFCCGGRCSEQELTPLCESFEPIANSWTPENQLPAGCSEFSIVNVDQELVLLLGGVSRSPNGDAKCQSHAWRFGLVKSSNPYLDYEYDWQSLPQGASLPTARGLRGHSAVLDSRLGRLYVIGGSHEAAAASGSAESAASDGVFYCDVGQFKSLAEQIDRSGQASVTMATVAWRRRRVPACGRVWTAAAMLGHKIFVVGGTRLPTSKREEKEEEKGEGEEEEEEAAKEKEKGEEKEADEDVGYYDTRRKIFRGLFSLSNCGMDTRELLAVTVSPQTNNRDLRPDRLDWLLQWSLW